MPLPKGIFAAYRGLLGRSDGQDTVRAYWDTAPGKFNVLQFKLGMQAADLQLQRNGDNLLLRISGTDDQVTVNGFFYFDNPYNAANPLQQVRFHDGYSNNDTMDQFTGANWQTALQTQFAALQPIFATHWL